MLINITLLIILLLLTYTTFSTLIYEVKYIVVTKHIKTFPLKRGNEVLPTWYGETLNRKKTVMEKHIIHYFYKYLM